MTCDMEEHTHTEECSTAEETDKTEVAEETTEPEEEMSGMEIDPSLPVMGTAYASGAKTRAYSVMTLDADTTGATNPVSVETISQAQRSTTVPMKTESGPMYQARRIFRAMRISSW